MPDLGFGWEVLFVLAFVALLALRVVWGVLAGVLRLAVAAGIVVAAYEVLARLR